MINGLGTGYVVNFGEGGESFAHDLRDVQPTIFAAVPRVWEKMLATVEIKMADASALKRWSYRAALRRAPGRTADLLALRALRDKLGLARVERALCGAAPSPRRCSSSSGRWASRSTRSTARPRTPRSAP